jgi:multidrug efflux pump subunit AcrA (membrane-fusion protein)
MSQQPERLIQLVGLDPERLARLESLAVAEERLAEAEATLERAIARLLEAEAAQREIKIRLDQLESWAQDPQVPFPQVGTRLRDLELKLAFDQRAAVEALVQRIRAEPALRELLRGPQGRPGEDGKPGPAGDAGATVIREVKISG